MTSTASADDDQPSETLTNRPIAGNTSNVWSAIRMIPSAIGIQPYAQLPACVSDKGHKFAIGMYHKDRACCERCGLIREVKA